MANNAVAEQSDVSDIESSEFIKKNERILYGPYTSDSNAYCKQKYNTLKVLSVAIICLLIGLLAGGYLQALFNLYSIDTNSNTITTTLPIQGDPDTEFGVIADNKRKAKKQKRAARRNEAECASRRCCNIRDGLKQNDLPNGLHCKQLSDEECGEMNEFCEWDCDPSKNSKKRRKRYRGISLFKGKLQEPEPGIDNNVGPESYEKCLEDGHVITVDDCGVQYDEELDPIDLETFCTLHGKEDVSVTNAEDMDPNDESLEDDEEDEDDDEVRRLAVLGSDGRIKVTSTSHPYNTVMYLNYQSHNGGTYRCTATMIKSKWAITAAHCVWGSGDWYSNFKLYKNVRSCSDKTTGYEYTISRKVMFSSYKSSQNANYDMAILQLSVDPSGVGNLGFGYSTSFSGTHYFNIISHPGDKSDCSKWRQYCAYTGWTTLQMKTPYCDTYGGASGSALYRYSSSGSRIIYGVHSGYSSGLNVGTRITSSKFNTICNYVGCS